jgi:hypothetical protein
MSAYIIVIYYYLGGQKMNSYKFIYKTQFLSVDAKNLTGGDEIYDLEELNIEKQKEAIAITLKDLIGSISQRATEGKYFLLTNINYPQWDMDGNLIENNLKEKAIVIGHYPIENKTGRTEDNYPDIGVLNKLLTPDVVKQIIISGIAIACQTDSISHWEYNFLKASEMFQEWFQVIGFEDEGGDIISQSYIGGEYDSGFISSDEEFQDGYTMNYENSNLQHFSFVFNDPEALK